MDKKNILRWSIIIILILNVWAILYLGNFRLIAFNENLYKAEFTRYGVYDEFPDEDIEQINSDLLHYLRYDKTDDLVDIDMFNQREKEHLKEVKDVIQKSLTLLGILILASIILLIILYSINKERFVKNLSLVCIWGGIIALLDAAAFFIWSKINFDMLFELFHNIFFKTGTWLFDSNDKLVMLYQGKIFYDILMKIVLATLIAAFLLIIFGMFIGHETKNKKIYKQRKKR